MSERYVTETVQDSFWPGDVVVLRDAEAGSWARIAPAFGCSLFSFGAVVDGRDVETFLQPADESTDRAPGNYGAPVLYPFPNRLRAGLARFGGRTIAIDRPPGAANAIHGLVRQRPWTVEATAATAEGATLRCSIESDAEIERQFPFPFRLTLTFRLKAAALRVEVEATNRGNAPMPGGFGWHPYFRLPLIPGGNRRAALVQVPARRLWQLDDDLLPTGEIVAPAPERDFRRPRPLGSLYLDDVYTDVERVSGASRCALTDPASGVTLHVAAGPTFREWVAYAPPTRPTLCFEPYTCPTDAFNLEDQGIAAGVIVLKPGERWNDWIELTVSGTGR